MLRIALILAFAEVFCILWNAGFLRIDFSNLYTQGATFALIDYLTIKIFRKYPIIPLTKLLEIILWMSIITHAFGGYAWITYNQIWLEVYDDFLKDWIFLMELMAFIAYGIFGGGKRLRTLATTFGLDDVSSDQGNHRNYQVSERRARK